MDGPQQLPCIQKSTNFEACQPLRSSKILDKDRRRESTHYLRAARLSTSIDNRLLVDVCSGSESCYQRYAHTLLKDPQRHLCARPLMYDSSVFVYHPSECVCSFCHCIARDGSRNCIVKTDARTCCINMQLYDQLWLSNKDTTRMYRSFSSAERRWTLIVLTGRIPCFSQYFRHSPAEGFL